MAGIAAGLRFVAAAVLTAGVLAAAPAKAQESTVALERRLQGMLDSFERRFSAVDEQLRLLTSLVERLERNQAEYSRETLGLIDEISLRLSELAVARPVIASPPLPGQSDGTLGILQIPGGEGGAVAGAGAALTEVDPNDLLIDDLLDAVGGSAADEASLQGPNELYAAAQGLLTENRWTEAIEAFNEFLEFNPDHELASEAKYWLGEAYYGTENYNQAAAMFLQLVREHRQSDRVPSSWLRIGMSLYNGGRPDAACQAYTEAAKFVDADRRDRERLQREQARAGCV